MEKVKTLLIFLEVVEKITIIVGVIWSAYFFLYREEHKTHLVTNTEVLAMDGCTFRYNVEVENTGALPFSIAGSYISIFYPDFDSIQKLEHLSRDKITSQSMSSTEYLRPGEISSFGFNLSISDLKPETAYIVAKIGINLKEDDDKWLRLIQLSANTKKCFN